MFSAICIIPCFIKILMCLDYSGNLEHRKELEFVNETMIGKTIDYLHYA